jgi:predicted membrane-bound spermidine synthase
MHDPLLELAAFFVTYLLFGAVGYPLARKFRTPVAPGTWVAISLSIVILGFSRRGEMWLFAVDGFHVYLLNAVQAFVIGILIGLIVRETRTRRVKKETA